MGDSLSYLYPLLIIIHSDYWMKYIKKNQTNRKNKILIEFITSVGKRVEVIFDVSVKSKNN